MREVGGGGCCLLHTGEVERGGLPNYGNVFLEQYVSILHRGSEEGQVRLERWECSSSKYLKSYLVGDGLFPCFSYVFHG
jgi:hypothetical protein